MKILLLDGDPAQKECIQDALNKFTDTLQKAGMQTEVFWYTDVQTQILKNEEEKNFFSEKTTKRAAAFFREKGYQMISCTWVPDNDENAIAKQLWKSHTSAKSLFSSIVPLFKQLYQAMDKDFTYSMDELTTDEKSSVLNLCKSLSNHGWVTFEISKEKDFITLHQLNAKQHRMFYNGGWAETLTRYLILKKLSDFGKQHKISHKVFQNIKLKKINSTAANTWDMELDILVDFGKRFYVFETKSGCNLGVEKWVDRARLFGTNENRFILCCTEDQLNPKYFAPYNLFCVQQLEEQLEKMLQNDFAGDARLSIQ